MSLTRDITTVGGGTLMSRLLAFGRDAGIAALLGTTPFSEAFFAMLQVINFFRRLLAEGALNGAFVPIWLKLHKRKNGAAAANHFTLRSLIAMFGITGVITIATTVFAWFVIGAVAPGFDESRRALGSYLLLLASPYIVLSGLVAVLAAALNAERRVFAVTASTVMFNVVMVAAVITFFDADLRAGEITLLLAATIVLAGLVQFLVASVAWLAFAKPWRGFRERVPGQTIVFFRRALPGLIATGIPQLKMIAATAIVSGSPAAVSWLYYANRLYELPLGVVSIAVASVIVPRIATSVHEGDSVAFAASQSRAYEIALGLALPAAAGFAVLAEPIAGGLFEHGAFSKDDTAAVATALMAICAGLPGHVLDKVFGAVSFAHEDTRTPMFTALGGLAAAIICGLTLYFLFGFAGAAAAIAVSGWVGAALLGITLYRRGWLRLDDDAARRLRLILLSTVVMGFAVATILMAAPLLSQAAFASSLGRLSIVVVLVAFGVAIYATALHVTGVIRLKDLVMALRRDA
jgi:putative peptidoglycan lipid II flippase